MNNELSTKLFRLSTGEDIISSYLEDIENQVVILQHPMKLVYRRIPSGATVMAVLPWLPAELIKNDYATIDAADIVTILDLKDTMVEYYNNVVANFVLHTQNSEDALREKLFGIEPEELNLETVMEEKNNNIIH